MSIICPPCNIRFPHVQALREHQMDVHYVRHPFCCSQCCGKFHEHRSLVQHSRAKHEEGSECQFCEVMFLNLQDHHRVPCSQDAYDAARDAVANQEAVDNVEEMVNVPSRKNIEGEVRNGNNGNVACDKCGKRLKDKKTLRAHMVHVHPENPTPFPCDKCGRIYSQEKNLHTHDRNDHKDWEEGCKPICCYSKCQKLFETPYELHNHIQNDHLIWHCDCGHSVETEEGLKKHIRTHEGIDYECPTCFEIFPSEPSLQGHLRKVHGCTGDKGKCALRRAKKIRRADGVQLPANAPIIAPVAPTPRDPNAPPLRQSRRLKNEEPQEEVVVEDNVVQPNVEVDGMADELDEEMVEDVHMEEVEEPPELIQKDDEMAEEPQVQQDGNVFAVDVPEPVEEVEDVMEIDECLEREQEAAVGHVPEKNGKSVTEVQAAETEQVDVEPVKAVAEASENTGVRKSLVPSTSNRVLTEMNAAPSDPAKVGLKRQREEEDEPAEVPEIEQQPEIEMSGEPALKRKNNKKAAKKSKGNKKAKKDAYDAARDAVANQEAVDNVEEMVNVPSRKNIEGEVRNGNNGNVACDKCGKRLKDKKKLHNHIQNDHLIWHCDCGHSVETEEGLKKHIRTHEGIDYECPTCFEIFPSEPSLQGHLRKVHGCTGDKGKCALRRAKKIRRADGVQLPANAPIIAPVAPTPRDPNAPPLRQSRRLKNEEPQEEVVVEDNVVQPNVEVDGMADELDEEMVEDVHMEEVEEPPELIQKDDEMAEEPQVQQDGNVFAVDVPEPVEEVEDVMEIDECLEREQEAAVGHVPEKNGKSVTEVQAAETEQVDVEPVKAVAEASENTGVRKSLVPSTSNRVLTEMNAAPSDPAKVGLKRQREEEDEPAEVPEIEQQPEIEMSGEPALKRKNNKKAAKKSKGNKKAKKCCAPNCNLSTNEQLRFGSENIRCVGKTGCLIPPGAEYKAWGNTMSDVKCYNCMECWGRLGKSDKNKFKTKINQNHQLEQYAKCTQCKDEWHIVCARFLKNDPFVCKKCGGAEPEATVDFVPRTPLDRKLEAACNRIKGSKVKISVISFRTKTKKELSEIVPKQLVKVFEKDLESDKMEYDIRSIYVFERVDGIDVPFLIMYTQEYQKQKTCIFDYLDTLPLLTSKDQRPAGFKFNICMEVILGYYDYMQSMGFTGGHFWAKPPVKHDSYIFHIHPEDQKYLDQAELESWYIEILKIGVEKGILKFRNFTQEEALKRYSSPTEMAVFDGSLWAHRFGYVVEEIKEFEGKENYVDEFMKKLRKNEYPVHATDNYYVDFANPAEDLHEEPYKTHKFMDSRDGFVRLCCMKSNWEFSSQRRAIYAAVAIINLKLRP